MRIGVISIEGGHNYGGILQCYAFMKQLQSYGHSVEFLRVDSAELSFVQRLWMLWATRRFSDVIKTYLRKKIYIVSQSIIEDQEKIFDSFRERYMQLSPVLTKADVGDYANQKYDAIIIGSDQIWAGLYNDSNNVFIGWTPAYQGRKFSYASCSPYPFLRDPFRKKQIKNYLLKFDYITVRDENTKGLIESIIGKKVEIQPDPVVSYAFSEFLTKESPANSKYILAYILGEEISGGHFSAILKIKKQFGNLKVYGIGTENMSNGMESIADVILNNVSPEDWVNWINHATCIYTDSFHAILFSIKFHKPFVGYYNHGIRASRLLYLKDTYINSTIISHSEEIEEIKVNNQVQSNSPFHEFMAKSGLVNCN